MRTLSYRDYLDRVKGAWAGKCAGGIYPPASGLFDNDFFKHSNGKQVAKGDDYVCYTPLNRMIDLTLPMGENRLVCKLLRADGPFRLSLFFSHRTHRDGGVTVDLRPL